MATITSEMVKDLRQRSGAGIMECKEALGETGGDMEAALDFLRKKGAAKAAKKADRSTKEGAIAGIATDKSAALAELKCETDFVGRNDVFQKLVKDITAHVLSSPQADDAAFAAQPFASDASRTVNDIVTAKIHELGENITIGRRVRFDLSGPGGFGLYIHGGGSIGVLVEVGSASADIAGKDKFKELCRDIAMHVAASSPIAVTPAEVPADLLAREKAVFEAQAAESGKPANIIPKIVEGRVAKYYSESCLIEQAFVKDPDKSVKKLLAEASKELGGEVTIRRFRRLQLGE
ncbi:MAG: elongation factor Ts [Nitrospinae bacterium]|nr:elongation factor Ts [Nitrospinota bacterium]